MRRYRFYKTDSNNWFIDLPEWEGSLLDLIMVEGADTMLDILADGKDDIFIDLSDKPFDGADVLTKDDEDRDGAYYIVTELNGVVYNMEIWLCEVTKFVFGGLPDKIYITA